MSFFDNQGRGGFMSNVPAAVKHIILINVLVMIMCYLKSTFMYDTFAMYFPASPKFEVWQPLTYLFMHGDFFHLFFNMYTLYIFGSVLERVWGTKKFLLFFFVTGVGAALVHACVQWYQYSELMRATGLSSAEIYNEVSQCPDGMKFVGSIWDVMFVPTVGASGAIYGILMGYAMLYPDSVLTLIFPPISLKAKWFVLIFAGIELLLGVTGTQAGVAHFAHLGGLIFGFALIMYWKRKHTLYGRFH